MSTTLAQTEFSASGPIWAEVTQADATHYRAALFTTDR